MKKIAADRTFTDACLRKFAPEPPVTYPAVASQIGLLRNAGAQAVIDFYIALGAWRREIETVAAEFERHPNRLVHGEPVRLLARRLRPTLPPGKRALEALAKRVPGAEEIERNAMKDGDSLFPMGHPDAGKTVRERSDIMLATTNDK